MAHSGIAYHLAQLVIFALAVLIAERVVPGIRVRGFGSALLFALVFAVVNKLLFGVLVFFGLPLVLITFGLFILVINAFLFKLADRLTPGITVEGFGAAFFGALVTSVMSTAMQWVLGL